MIRRILPNKWIIGVISLLIIAITFIVLVEIDFARHKRQIKQDRLAVQARARAASVKQSTQKVSPAENETPPAEKPITHPIVDVKTVDHPHTETETPQPAALSAEIADEAEVAVSAFGFGPFPEVPEGMTDFVGNPFVPEWLEPDYPNYEGSRDFELMSRVQIKAWKEGILNNAIGASMEANGSEVYINYPDTIYFWYEEINDDEGQGFALDTSGGGDVRLTIEQFQRGDIPPGIRLIDGKTAGIDVYEYLNLER